MSGGIFYLDEDRDNHQSPAPSPRASPRTSPILSATEPPTSPVTQPSSSPSALIPSGSALLQIPTASPPNIFNPQQANKGRKNAMPFAATPSFPSPLAQAITVPSHSDTSSSGSHTDEDEDVEGVGPAASKGLDSPSRSNASGTPRLTAENLPRPRTASPNTSRSGSPNSLQKSASRPPSPKGTQIITPSSLLRSKRSGSGSLLSGNLPNPISTSRDSLGSRNAPLRVSPTHPGHRRFSNVTRNDSPDTSPTSPVHRRGSSSSNAGQTPAFGSPELEPIRSINESPSRSLRAGSSSSNRDSKDGIVNVLGLGWNSGASGGWETASNASSAGISDKGKAKDLAFGSSSPRALQRERERSGQPLGLSR